MSCILNHREYGLSYIRIDIDHGIIEEPRVLD